MVILFLLQSGCTAYFSVHSIAVSAKFLISYLGKNPSSPFFGPLVNLDLSQWSIYLQYFLACTWYFKSWHLPHLFWTLIFNHVITGTGDGWDLTVHSLSVCQACCCFPISWHWFLQNWWFIPSHGFKCRIFVHISGISTTKSFMIILWPFLLDDFTSNSKWYLPEDIYTECPHHQPLWAV